MEKFNLQSLQRRAISAFILIPTVLLGVIWGGGPFYLMVGILACISVHEWVMMARKTPDFLRSLLIGLVYILVGYVACIFIREAHSFMAGVLFLLMIWSSDIGAYFTGKFIGGPKMAPKISPNKTWAGLAGACDFPACAGVVFYLIYNAFSVAPHWSLSAVMYIFVLGLVIGLVGQVGDLLVSAFKRKADVKDTGTLIPGHGGVLDRVDAMLLAAPAYYVLYAVFGFQF